MDQLPDTEFDVDGVACKSQSSYLVTVGTNIPKKLRFPVKMRVGEDRDAAVRRHAKFVAASEFVAQSNGNTCPNRTPAIIVPSAACSGARLRSMLMNM